MNAIKEILTHLISLIVRICAIPIFILSISLVFTYAIAMHLLTKLLQLVFALVALTLWVLSGNVLFIKDINKL